MWCHSCTPLFPALGRQRQVDPCEFEANLVYKASSRTAKAVIQRNSVLNFCPKQKTDLAAGEVPYRPRRSWKGRWRVLLDLSCALEGHLPTSV